MSVTKWNGEMVRPNAEDTKYSAVQGILLVVARQPPRHFVEASGWARWERSVLDDVRTKDLS